MKKPNEVLNQSAQKLAEKHQQRLQKMTLEALSAAEKKSFFGSLSFLLPQPAYAAAALLFISAGVGWLSLQNSGETERQVVAQLPEWLSDEQVPMELLENPDFYQWLAKQPKIPQA